VVGAVVADLESTGQRFESAVTPPTSISPELESARHFLDYMGHTVATRLLV